MQAKHVAISGVKVNQISRSTIRNDKKQNVLIRRSSSAAQALGGFAIPSTSNS